MKSCFLKTMVLVIATLCLSTLAASAQSKGKSSKSGSSSSSSASSSGSSQGEDGSTGMGFSIETEMFTYRAVEQNSKVIACDIAQYLYGGSLEPAGAGSHAPCVVQNTSGPAPGIVLVSSESTLLSDFQIWRADMAMMNSLESRADQACVAKPEAAGAQPAPGQQGPGQQGPGMGSRGLLGDIISNASPATAAASSAGDVMKMLGTTQSVMSVVGTVQDPALLNEVARQLRALNVQVLVPEMYNPNALGGADSTHSPYLNNLQKLFTDYDKCDKAKASYGQDVAATADMTAVLAGIDAFLKSSFATAGAEIPGAGTPAAPGSTAQTPPAQTQAPTESHFTVVMAADELAREMGFSGDGSGGPNPTWQHLLWLQALESGGSVTRQGNLFGTKVYFGGGAVDTYSVFRIDGQLACSGNVYSFQAPVKLADLEKTFAHQSPGDPTKSPLLDSTCGTLPPLQH